MYFDQSFITESKTDINQLQNAIPPQGNSGLYN
jgi:hypothetical protein